MNPFKFGITSSAPIERGAVLGMREHMLNRRFMVVDAVDYGLDSRPNSDFDTAMAAQITRSQVELNAPQPAPEVIIQPQPEAAVSDSPELAEVIQFPAQAAQPQTEAERLAFARQVVKYITEEQQAA